MKQWSSLAFLLSFAAPLANAQAASDLIYKYKQVEVAPLKAYDGRPYWRVLAECAGVHGALANRYEAAGRAPAYEAAKAQGVSLLIAANQQLQADRGLAAAEARALTLEAVDAGRSAGASFLTQRPASGHSHEQLIDLLCTQAKDSHARALRFR